MAEHFVAPPDWLWYILFYFFLAGLSGGSYVIASLLRLRGDPRDAALSRLGYYAAWPPLLICPILLILDLGAPLRFWHMMWNLTPGDQGIMFKYWSPMSVGVWGLIIFSGFATISFAESLARDGKLVGLTGWVARLLDGFLGKLFTIVGLVFALFIAGYTGVLLAVSNQPVWSDTWALGGLFLASGLSGSAALLMFLTRFRPAARESFGMLAVSERLYALLEGALIVVFALTLLWAGTQGLVFGFPWLLLWLVALAGLLPGLRGLVVHRLSPAGEATATAAPVLVPLLVLAGVLALRGAVIFSIQV